MRAALLVPSFVRRLLLLPTVLVACAASPNAVPAAPGPASVSPTASGAASASAPGSANAPAHANAACLGEIATPAGFAPRADDGSVVRLCGAPDTGNFWQAAAFVSTQPVRIYRLYSEHQDPSPGIPGRKAGRFGRWWSTDKPTGTRQQYREAYAVCSEWNDLDVLVTCTLPASSLVGIGTSQSVQCPGSGHLDRSPTLQVFVPDAPKLEQTGACTSTPWP